MDDCIKCLINWNNCLHADLNYSFVHYRDRMRSSRVAVTCGGLSLVGACQRALWLVETEGQDDGNYRAGVIGLFVCFDRPDSQCFSKSTPDCRASSPICTGCMPLEFWNKTASTCICIKKASFSYILLKSWMDWRTVFQIIAVFQYFYKDSCQIFPNLHVFGV